MYLEVQGRVVEMRSSVGLGKDAFDVLLHITEAKGAPGAKVLIGRKIVFNGVSSEKSFFAGDIIILRYSEELGPRHFRAEILQPHQEFTDILRGLKHSDD